MQAREGFVLCFLLLMRGLFKRELNSELVVFSHARIVLVKLVVLDS